MTINVVNPLNLQLKIWFASCQKNGLIIVL